MDHDRGWKVLRRNTIVVTGKSSKKVDSTKYFYLSSVADMSGCAPPFLRSGLTNKTKLRIKISDTSSNNASTESLPGYFDQQIHNILVRVKSQFKRFLDNMFFNKKVLNPF